MRRGFNSIERIRLRDKESFVGGVTVERERDRGKFDLPILEVGNLICCLMEKEFHDAVVRYGNELISADSLIKLNNTAMSGLRPHNNFSPSL